LLPITVVETGRGYMAAKGQGTHYIDNERFLKELIAHRKAIAKAKKEGKKPPGVNNYIGQCFLDIANNLAKKPNFANYTYKEEMVCDSVENCIMYAGNFDPRKSRNPFAFFTQIIYYAFLRRIQREKKQLYVKMKCFEENDPTGRFRNWMEDKHLQYGEGEQSPFADFITGEISAESLKPKKKRRKRKVQTDTKGLDEVMEDL
jgi:hypothetical protein